MSRKHQSRIVSLFLTAEPGIHIELEAAIPESSRAIDMMFDLEEPSDAWGLLAKDMRQRRILVEHYCRPPAAAHFANALLKLYWAVEQWLKSPKDRKPRPPLLLMISVGQPRKALGLFSLLLKQMPTPGIYHSGAGLVGEIILLDVRRLAMVSGTGFLKLFDHRQAAWQKNIEHLLKDTELSTMTRRRIVEAIMERPAFDSDEAKTTYDSIIDKGIEMGIDRGIKEGIKEGGAAVLLQKQLAKRFGELPDWVVQCLDGAGIEQLTCWGERVLDANSLQEVFDDTSTSPRNDGLVSSL